MNERHVQGTILIFMVIVVSISGCGLFDNEKKCTERGGVWYEDACIDRSTSDARLSELGLLEEELGKFYEIRIEYPFQALNYPVIHEHLKDMVRDIRKQQGFGTSETEGKNRDHLWKLIVDMSDFSSAAGHASILVYTFSYTGGAHPNHHYISLNFNTMTSEIITLDELFKDEKYLYAISDHVTSQLLREKSEKLGERIESDEWIERGAFPFPGNFQIFLFVPYEDQSKLAGLKFIFPPYTVGPYSEGMYEVYVDSKIFSKYLKDRYRELFE